MIEILLIDKTGNLNLVNFKEINYDLLYKIANCKTKKNFKLLKIFNYKDITFELYGKKSGISKNKNIYKFPLELESNDIYDTCILLQKKNDQILTFNLNLWNKYLNDNSNIKDLDSYKSHNNTLESDSEEEELDSDSELKEESYIYTDEEIID